jgi:MFS family permease
MSEGATQSQINEDAALGASARTEDHPQAIYVLVTLFFINILNFADRSILSVLADPIKQDLHVTDTQLGFLAGTSFVVLNSIAGLAMGSVADIWLRNRMLSIAVGFWSGLTALSGLSATFVQLAAARLGVGLGEAVGNPVSHSLMADMFSPRNRARAFAIYYCAP